MAARAIVLTGGLGTGKTTALQEALTLAGKAGLRAAAIDLDWLGWATGADRSPDALIARNLAAVAANYEAAGIANLLLARGLQDSGALALIKEALPAWEIVAVRLSVPRDVAERRLRARDTGGELEEHLADLDRMAAATAAAVPEAPVVDAAGSPRDVATAVLRLAGWMDE